MPSRSTKPSGTRRQRRPPPREITFFLDNDTSACAVFDALQQKGLSVTRLRNHFPPDTPDHEWLPFVGRKGWILVSRNKWMRYNPREVTLIRKHKVRGFFLTGSKPLRGDQMASILVRALDRIFKFLQDHSGPFVVNIRSDSSLHEWEGI